MVIAEIIKWYQHKVYLNLIKIYGLDYPGNVVDLDTAEIEEPLNYRIRNMMTEKRAVIQ